MWLTLCLSLLPLGRGITFASTLLASSAERSSLWSSHVWLCVESPRWARLLLQANGSARDLVWIKGSLMCWRRDLAPAESAVGPEPSASLQGHLTATGHPFCVPISSVSPSLAISYPSSHHPHPKVLLWLFSPGRPLFPSPPHFPIIPDCVQLLPPPGSLLGFHWPMIVPNFWLQVGCSMWRIQSLILPGILVRLGPGLCFSSKLGARFSSGKETWVMLLGEEWSGFSHHPQPRDRHSVETELSGEWTMSGAGPRGS